mmetsp:Transcript_26331/g.60656  ORF Transcript_26331/g.60656 Transcript_26331/m.60656 type:complete len:361 (-) Transcript_26331:945-2027(-)|eukprot:CAMPEP_0113310392 /NCGR_PEP_ID=MMETSP0010_2-20120614/8056_1 /TAXON_ID=216773 ORGANISM="Corethron hystrix, Strain 308" /NCGR_SAMPLE_ID=MMETSP0010_2 /ASSEMBLY_ACC=CAM_ASM_000155 /LENGTH=360 /DNA_ID=CAMNT_0000165839 /DNA_START=8 /DNA_END=1090 /DNA_ORIENTATION=- /assembly_acc=CAM_ASM_000155
MQLYKAALCSLFSVYLNFISAKNISTEIPLKNISTESTLNNVQDAPLYIIMNDGKCLQPAAAANNRPIQRKSCNSSNNLQKWKLDTQGIHFMDLSETFFLAPDANGILRLGNEAFVNSRLKRGKTWYIDTLGRTIRFLENNNLLSYMAQLGGLNNKLITGTPGLKDKFEVFLITDAPTASPTGSPTLSCFDNDGLYEAIAGKFNDVNFSDIASTWRTCEVTDMEGLIADKPITGNAFNFGNWDTSLVTTMERAFAESTVTEAGLGSWDTSSVANMNLMFFLATNYNEDLSGWDVSNVKYFKAMFAEAETFNQDITGWNIESAENMWSMFNHALIFSVDVKTVWDLTGVNTNLMFSNSPLA